MVNFLKHVEYYYEKTSPNGEYSHQERIKWYLSKYIYPTYMSQDASPFESIYDVETLNFFVNKRDIHEAWRDRWEHVDTASRRREEYNRSMARWGIGDTRLPPVGVQTHNHAFFMSRKPST